MIDAIKNFTLVSVLVVIAVLVVIVGPLLVIWALNTLFPMLAIPYTFWTWSAVVFLGSFFRANITFKK
jgi:hypothetical protein